MTAESPESSPIEEISQEPERDAEVDPAAGDSPVEEAPEAAKGSKEAAKYRHQLRATEAERDGIAARLESVQRSQVEVEVTRLGVKPAAVWAAGVELGDLLAEDGTVDPKLVANAVAGVRDQFGIAQQSTRRKTGLHSGLGKKGPAPNRWAGAFAPKGGD